MPDKDKDLEKAQELLNQAKKSNDKAADADKASKGSMAEAKRKLDEAMDKHGKNRKK